MKKFEERLERLEELAERIKEPDLPLEDAVAVFEEGIKLSKGLQRDLDKIQGKVELLLGSSTGEDGEEKADLGLFDDEEEPSGR
jgi:exodeoxyribonuclease VII small subunit